MLNLATLFPLTICFISGSAPKRPINCTLFKLPAIIFRVYFDLLLLKVLYLYHIWKVNIRWLLFNRKKMLKKIVVKGAKEHNLKNVSLEIPKEKLVVITGLSGSAPNRPINSTLFKLPAIIF